MQNLFGLFRALSNFGKARVTKNRAKSQIYLGFSEKSFGKGWKKNFGSYKSSVPKLGTYVPKLGTCVSKLGT